MFDASESVGTRDGKKLILTIEPTSFSQFLSKRCCLSLITESWYKLCISVNMDDAGNLTSLFKPRPNKFLPNVQPSKPTCYCNCGCKNVAMPLSLFYVAFCTPRSRGFNKRAPSLPSSLQRDAMYRCELASDCCGGHRAHKENLLQEEWTEARRAVTTMLPLRRVAASMRRWIAGIF